MGFLTTNGMLMTYDDYKAKIKCYKGRGIGQLANLLSIH